MSLSQFLHYNHYCPICHEPLHLYMQWIPGNDPMLPPFRAEFVEPSVYRFKPVSEYNPSKDLLGLSHASADLFVSLSDFILLTEQHDDVFLHFNNKSFEGFSKTFQVYFYFLCNPAGMKKKWQTDYEIDLYKGCYYRSSPFMEMRQDGTWKLRKINESHKNMANLHEAFSLKETVGDKEKVYMVNIDHENDRTRLWHYTVSAEQKESDYFEANLFEKEMPMMKKGFKFEDRKKMLDRLGSWVMMS